MTLFWLFDKFFVFLAIMRTNPAPDQVFTFVLQIYVAEKPTANSIKHAMLFKFENSIN